MNVEHALKELSHKFSTIDYVDAVVLSGSRTGKINDNHSDYDIYIYSSQSIPLGIREELIKEHTDNYVIGNTFFEDGDELTLRDGVSFDLMYRSLQFVNGEIDWVWRKHNAKVGYTTCFLYNIKTSKILFDRNGEFKKLQDELGNPYPKELTYNILAKNYPLLREKDASYYDQIKLAEIRNDKVSIVHRTAALFNSYFDIIFAINRQLHPGEKKLVDYVEVLCQIKPHNFREDVENVVKSVGDGKLRSAIDKMLNELDRIIV